MSWDTSIHTQLNGQLVIWKVKEKQGALMEAYGDIMGKLLQTGIITHLKQYIGYI